MSERAARHLRRPADLVALLRAGLAAALLVTAFLGLARAFAGALALSLVGALARLGQDPVLGRPPPRPPPVPPGGSARALRAGPPKGPPSDGARGLPAGPPKGPSRWGARLDAWATVAAIASVPLGSNWLRPEMVHSDAITYWGLVAAIAVPITFAFVKYGALAGYRARAARIAACVVMGAAALLVAGGPTWPLHVATALLAVAALEDIAVIAVLPRPAPAASLPIALRVRGEQMADADE
jgi:CDP-diacylglycerol--glycerol-3-phosphate 3-phosphatidyltransferase